MSGHMILAAEDEPVDAMMLQRAFGEAGIPQSLYIVDNGDDAIGYLKGEGVYTDREQHPLPSLILLDLKLPRRSGLEVLEWLRRQPGLRRIPVVIFTSSRQSEGIAKAYDLGANSCLVKPLQFHSLLNMMRTVGLYWLMVNEKPPIEGDV